jgi:hypothetical protein
MAFSKIFKKVMRKGSISYTPTVFFQKINSDLENSVNVESPVKFKDVTVCALNNRSHVGLLCDLFSVCD